MKPLADMKTRLYDVSEIGIFIFLSWFGGLTFGVIIGIGLGWLIF
jgi:hypothetical protein